MTGDFLTAYEADENDTVLAFRTSEKCGHCKKAIDEIPVWVPKLTAKATRLSPEEWDEIPMHIECAETVTSREYQDYCDEMESLRGYSDEQRSRI
jgi:hypothetical protein